MKIQIVSDLHLEFRGEKFTNLFNPSAPILCMVGDICACGNPRDFQIFIKFLKYITPKYQLIFHVAGNHEYYTAGASSNEIKINTIKDIDIKLKKLKNDFPNYHFLNNDTYELKLKNNKQYIFIGSTLWSFIPKHLYKKIEERMNDYNHIYVKTNKKIIRKFNVLDMQKKHKLAVSFIKKILDTPKLNTNYILLTHHKPIFDRNSNEQDIYTFAYESKLQNIIIKPPLKLAAHGHTHISYNKIINKVHIISNPKGYINEKTKFNENLAINI
jgi:Icc-related predicted phosphoesterase